MENNNVEIAKEPKIESRFGFGQGKNLISKTAMKYGAVTSGASLLILFLLKSPEPSSSQQGWVKTPETTEVSSNSNQSEFQNYSVVEESARLQEKNKKQKVQIVVRLPGLQKIDRRQNGKIPPGSMIKAILITGASNGPVRAEVTQDLRVQGERFIPAGATLLGVGQSTEERLMIRFNQVVYKDGSFENVQAQAADKEDQTVGLKGSRVGRYAMKYATAIGLNFVGGMAEGLQDREIVGQQVVTKPDAKNALLNGTSKATYEMANETMTDLKNSAPVIQIPAGQEILVMFDGN